MRTPGSHRYLVGAAAALAVAALMPRPAAATADITTTLTSTVSPSTSGTAHVVEWDLTNLPDQVDIQAGAVATDTRGEDHNQLWFVSRMSGTTSSTLDGQRVYRFNPSESLLKGDARWTAWGLRVDTFVGGLKRVRPSHDRRFVFVRSAQYVQRIDTGSCYPATAYARATCDRVVWSAVTPPDVPDQFVSDIATDDRNRVFTTGFDAASAFGYVQMIDPAAAAIYDGKLWTVKAQRWIDDQGSGRCLSGPASGFCNAGVDVHPSKQNLVYFVESGTNDSAGFIAELNIANTKPSVTSPNVRRWSLTQLGIATGDTTIDEPRVLKIDRSGKIWVNTASGHLISLDPNTNRMTKHLMPEGASNDPWAVAPDDDVVGYTGSQTNKVAMMFPKRKPVTIDPSKGVMPIASVDLVITKERGEVTSGTVPGEPKIVATKVTANGDGLFIEGLVSTGQTADDAYTQKSDPSLIPLGITANRGKSQGSFFYTVGASAPVAPTSDVIGVPANAVFVKRIGHIRLPMKDRAKFPRDDDDADDGFDRNKNPRWHNAEQDDEDADAVSDRYDTPSSRENATSTDPASLAAAQTADYQVVTSATPLALIATVQPDSLTATVAVDVYNSLGTLVGTSGPLVGIATATVPTPGAGTFTVRVRNLSAVPITYTPTFVVRDPALPLP